MSKNNAYNGFALSNPGKNKGQGNSVNSVAKRVDQSFETADDHLMDTNYALNRDVLAYASDVKNRLG